MSSLESKDISWITQKQLIETLNKLKFFPKEIWNIISEYGYEESLFAIGGYDGSSYLNTMERFDIAKQVWEEMPRMKSKRDGLGVVAI